MSVAIWASVSFWLMSIEHGWQLTWAVSLLLGMVLFALLVQRLIGELRLLRSLRQDSRSR
ncbi:hypothetical protein NML43_00375 [Rhodopseudomonas palustris]|uniref:hypothetical protein n=1 Tax=Rhodopseudomonas palustris TaxID=1076 RepID=UPI0020CDD259|nr:hypothetical protein [Rhodopseudomonas palustris]MCP9625529.1 hypothetical protein [Rhodopseudomonas palustris]